jgi:hypothetical protein
MASDRGRLKTRLQWRSFLDVCCTFLSRFGRLDRFDLTLVKANGKDILIVMMVLNAEPGTQANARWLGVKPNDLWQIVEVLAWAPIPWPTATSRTVGATRD